ncbi:hypothetical protein LCGC14_1155890 [marine sediment metagenome]|uniref:LexA repressor DNA-binding domain-containing protein n=1 Tax=marine sediment metagenome TaxID=412755 RepID=A0A0F9LU01_9ZZZZ
MPIQRKTPSYIVEEWILRFVKESGRFPTYREVVIGTGCSTNLVAKAIGIVKALYMSGQPSERGMKELQS